MVTPKNSGPTAPSNMRHAGSGVDSDTMKSFNQDCLPLLPPRPPKPKKHLL